MEALHIGLREACQLSFRHILVEAVLTCPIRLALGSCSVPWAYADMVEEIHDLSRDLEISFVNVKKSTNWWIPR